MDNAPTRTPTQPVLGPRVRRGVLHGVRCHLHEGTHKAHPFTRGDQRAWCTGR